MKIVRLASSLALVAAFAPYAVAVAQTSEPAAADEAIMSSPEAAAPDATPPADASAATAESSEAAQPEEGSSSSDVAADGTAAAESPSDPASEPASEPASDPASAEPGDGGLAVISLAPKEPPPVAEAEPETIGGLQEITVTAQRREESLQEVPISITVFDQEQLSNANVTGASDLATYTPSLSTNQRFGADNATFSIRGFTQELRTTPSVASYMAEVVAPRGQSSQTSGDGAGPGALFDLANVQVLKGPQGTLFGRNTTGGAVLLVPNKPSDEFEGYVELSGGERGSLRQQAVVNVPIVDSFKVRFAVDRNERDGHLKNAVKIGADELASVDYVSARLSSLWNVSDTVENYTILTLIDSNSTGFSAQLYGCNPDYAADPSNFFLAFAGAIHYPACQAQLARLAAAGQNGFYDIVSTIKSPKTDINEKRLINTLTWDITDDIALKNILAYAHLHTENGSDIFGTQFRYNVPGLTTPVLNIPGGGTLGGPIPVDPDPTREFKTGVSVVNPDIPVTSQETYIAELQIQGTSFDEALEWQGGLYYENSRPDGFSGNNSAGLLSCNLASLEGDAAGFNCYDPLNGQVGGVLVQFYKTLYLNQAAYSQLTWNINDLFSVTGGIRYTKDRAEGYGRKTRHLWSGPVRQTPPEGVTQITTPVAKSEAPTGLIEFDYKPFEGQMVYVKYLRGYRQGNVILAADPGVDTFDPEQVDTYELGIKTQFGGPIPGRFNMAAFYNDFQDQQLQLGYISPTSLQTTTIVNAGKSRIQGLEADAFFQLIERVTLGLSASLLDTKLLEQEDQSGRVGDAGGFIAASSVTPIADVGDQLPYAPKKSFVVSLNWEVPMAPEYGDVFAGVTYSFIGEQRSAATSSGPYGMLDAFELLNLNAGWTRILGSAMDLNLFATNVLDEEYTTYTSGTYNLLAYESRAVGTPRMIGARLKYNFGASR